MSHAAVYLLFHEADTASSRALRDRIGEICEERGWSFSSRGVPTFKSPKGRPVPLIPVDFAAGIYVKIHRTRAAILVLGTDPRVPLHPTQQDALRFARHVQLRRYVEYKCFYCKVSLDPNDSWAGMFSGWCEGVHCEGEHDPRCLPFHVFDGEGVGLNAAGARAKFNDRYGGGTSRTDDRGAEWRLWPAQYHGSESALVAGYLLPKAFHWDVNTGAPRELITWVLLAGIWALRCIPGCVLPARSRQSSGTWQAKTPTISEGFKTFELYHGERTVRFRGLVGLGI